MTDDKIAKDTARSPEREALGPVRGGIRAAAKRAARKVAKKVARKTDQKKVARKTTAAAGKTTKKAVKPATRTEKPAAAKVSAPASRTTPARRSASRTKAATGRAATKESATAGAVTASKGGASAPAVAPYEPGPAIETPRPPGPIHPGAAMDSMQEQSGGFGSHLALWGPLIIVAFLVLVFRGGEERESMVAAAPDVASQTAARTPETPASEPLAAGAFDPTGGALPDASMPDPSGAVRGSGEAYDSGFTMRTSMATPVYPSRGAGTGMPRAATRRLYPSPPGPYRDPRYRGLPTGESWSAGSAGEWGWTAGSRGNPGQEDGDGPVQWVRCAPPYHWCPAPSSPTW